jgi:hypothetical protein
MQYFVKIMFSKNDLFTKMYSKVSPDQRPPHRLFAEIRKSSRELGRGHVTQAAVRPMLVIIPTPGLDLLPGVFQCQEPMFIQAWVAWFGPTCPAEPTGEAGRRKTTALYLYGPYTCFARANGTVDKRGGPATPLPSLDEQIQGTRASGLGL